MTDDKIGEVSPLPLVVLYNGPSDMGRFLTQQTKDAGYELVERSSKEAPSLVLKVDCELRATGELIGGFNRQDFRISADVQLSQKGRGKLLKLKLVGRIPNSTGPEGRGHFAKREEAIQRMAGEIERLVWTSIPHVTGDVRRLISGLSHERPYVRGTAAYALGELRATNAVGALQWRLSDSWLCEGNYFDAAPDYLKDAGLHAKYTRGTVALACADALDKLGWQPATPGQAVLYRAAKGLFTSPCDERDATDALTTLLWDSNLNTRVNAARSLARSKDPSAVPELLRKLQELVDWLKGRSKLMGSRPEFLEEWQQSLLLEFHDDFVKQFGFPSKNVGGEKKPSAVLLEAVVRTLGSIGDSRAGEPLIELLQEDSLGLHSDVARALECIVGRELATDHDKLASDHRSRDSFIARARKLLTRGKQSGEATGEPIAL